MYEQFMGDFTYRDSGSRQVQLFSLSFVNFRASGKAGNRNPEQEREQEQEQEQEQELEPEKEPEWEEKPI